MVVASGLACAIASTLYILLATAPLYYFYGYVRGYYSLLDYKLCYTHNEQPIFMPHTDYIRHVSVTFILLSIILLSMSILSMALALRRPLVSSGIIYGASNGLVVLYGLLSGYVIRALSLDMARFNSLARDIVAFRTLAGTITFEGIKLEQTPIHSLIFSSPILIILLLIAVLASCAATALSLHIVYEQAPAEKRPRGWSQNIRQISAYAAISMLAFTALASVFAYYPSTLTASPQPPPATLEPPPYNYACIGLTRTARGALTYTDFETYPVPGWASSGGSWSSESGVTGAKGSVLQGTDDGTGLGRVSHYYYATSLSGYSSLWVATKTKWVSGIGWHGISMMNSGMNRLFTVEIRAAGATSGYLEIWSYNVATTGWYLHAQVTIPNYDRTSWYVVVVYYSVSRTTITITAYLYYANGSYVTSTSATITHRNVFAPAYIGVDVDNVRAYFDDFSISTVDPRSISFTGFYSDMRVEVWDNLGDLVNSTTAPASSFYLNVTSDIVVGTGVDGSIVVKCPDAYVCGVLSVPLTDAILGGDAYALSTAPIAVSLGANKTSSTITLNISSSRLFNTTTRFLRISSSQVLYARLILDNVSAPDTLNLSLWLEGVARSTSITIVDGVPISTSTSVVRLNLGLNNSIALAGYFSATGQTATLDLRLELCTAEGGLGACVYYPIELEIRSASSSSLSLPGSVGGSTDFERGDGMPYQDEQPTYGDIITPDAGESRSVESPQRA
ncbi:MAG: hypothetical protein QXQ31_05520 [Zestosphaera sp.]